MPLLDLFLCVASLAPGGGDVWTPLDLTPLRQREPVPKVRPSRPPDLPQGEFPFEGAPLRFARGSETFELTARGQRIPLAPADIGRACELLLACSWRATEPARLELTALGAHEVARVGVLACLPNEKGASWRVLRVPIASEWPIQALRLPEDDRLRVYAASVRPVNDAVENEGFRRAFMALEMPEPGMQRYLAGFAEGGHLHGKKEETPFERAIFEHLVAGRPKGALRVLELRLPLVEAKPPEVRPDHLHACLVLATRGGTARLAALRTLVALLEADTELAGALSGIDVVRALERSAPAEFERFAALVTAGRLEIAGLQETLDWSSPPSEGMLRESFDSGADYADQHGWKMLARPAILGDLAPQPLMPGWCSARGLVRCVQWSEGPVSPELPPLFGWRGSGPAGLLVTHMPAPSKDLGDAALEAELARTRLFFNSAEAWVALEVDAAGESARAAVDELRAFAAREGAPLLHFDTPNSYSAELRAGGRLQPVLLEARPGIDLGPSRVAPLALRSANRRAEIELESAARAAALARLDGQALPSGTADELGRTLRWNFGRTDAQALASSHSIAEQARAEALASVALLARRTDTTGEGQALFVFNPLPFERSGFVEVDADCVLDSDGEPLPVQLDHQGRRFFEARVPALGHAVFHARANGPVPDAGRAVKREGWTFTSSRLALCVDPETGELASLRLLPEDVELLGGSSDRLAFLTAGASEPAAFPTELLALELLEDGPLRVVLRRVRAIAGARVIEDLILERDRPELGLRCRVEGLDENGTLLAGFLPQAPLRDPFALVPLRGYMRAGADSTGLALLSADFARCAASSSGLWIELAEGGPLGQAESSFALRPFVGEADAAGLGAASDELAFPLLCVRAATHAGPRPAREARLELGRRLPDGGVASGGIELVALRPLGPGCELSWRESLGEPGELQLTCASGILAASALGPGLDSEVALKSERGQVRLPLIAWSAGRVRIRSLE